MNKVWLIFRREFLNRVQKKSFLIATIVIPLIFPAIIAVMIYIFVKQEEGAEKIRIEVLDKSGKIKLESGDRYEFITVTGELEQVKKDFKESKDFGILHIVPFELSRPEGMTLYTKENPSIRRIEDLERMLETQVHDLKLEQFNIDKETLKSLKTSVDISSIPLKDDGE